MNCSGVAVVVCVKRIVAMRAPWLRVTPSWGTCRGLGRAPTTPGAPRAEAEPQLRRYPRSRSRSAPVRMYRRRKQGGRGPHIGCHDMRRAQIGLDDELGQELAHRARREEIVSAFGCAEARQVNGEQAARSASVAHI